MIRFAENLNKMITAGLGGALEAPRTEVAVGHCISYLEASGPVASFESNIAAPIRNLRVDMHPIQAGSGDPSPDNVRPITGRDAVTVWREASYDPSADPALTIPLGQTVYGGTVDVTTGVLTVDRVKVSFKPNSISTWYDADINRDTLGFYSPVATWEQMGYPISATNDAIFEAYKNGAVFGVDTPYVARFLMRDEAMSRFEARVLKSVLAPFSSYLESQAAVIAYLTENPIEMCYSIATPQTITLDPATLSTLKGDNNVWSDAGDVTLKYPYYEETEGY